MKIYDIYNHYGYGSEFDDAWLYGEAWIQKCRQEEREDESYEDEIYSAPELGI